MKEWFVIFLFQVFFFFRRIIGFTPSFVHRIIGFIPSLVHRTIGLISGFFSLNYWAKMVYHIIFPICTLKVLLPRFKTEIRVKILKTSLSVFCSVL